MAEMWEMWGDVLQVCANKTFGVCVRSKNTCKGGREAVAGLRQSQDVVLSKKVYYQDLDRGQDVSLLFA